MCVCVYVCGKRVKGEGDEFIGSCIAIDRHYIFLSSQLLVTILLGNQIEPGSHLQIEIFSLKEERGLFMEL